MKNSHLKNSLIAAGIAVLAGVVTLGANVAFGGTTPTQDPSAAGLVAPTFSGLGVTGVSNLASLIVPGLLSVQGTLNVPGPSLLTNTSIAGNLGVTGATSLGNATVGGTLAVTGNSSLSGTLDILKAVTAHGNFTFDSVVGGSIYNTMNLVGFLNKNIVISSNNSNTSYNSILTIHGDGLHNQVDIGTGTTSGNLTVFGKAQTTGDVVVDGTLKASSDAQFSGGITMYSGNIHGAGISPVTVGSSLYANKDLIVSGKATATGGFGTFKRILSTPLSLAANGGTAEASAACPAGTYIVSCSGHATTTTYVTSTDAGYYNWTTDVTFNNIDPYTDNKCYVRGVNKNTTTARYVGAIAVCMDPAN